MENKYEWKYTDIYKTKEDYKEDIKNSKKKKKKESLQRDERRPSYSSQPQVNPILHIPSVPFPF